MDSSPLEPLFTFLSYSLLNLQAAFFSIPGSAVLTRYVKSSHQNDPGRTVLEVILALFVIRTLLQSRTLTDRSGKHFIQFSEKEIDDLVDEWTPEPLDPPLTEQQEAELAAIPVIAGPTGSKPKLVNTGKSCINLASLNFTGLAGNEHIQQRAIETMRKYGVGSCGPSGFYGTIDVHTELEQRISDFLGTESSVLYAQGFSTICSVIPAFCKRSDIIIADRGVNFAIQKGLQISRSTIRWYDHNDLSSLESVLESVAKEMKRRRSQKHSRKFIVTEGLFEQDGSMVDLPRLIELKERYKFRLILDETLSFGSVGRTGRGLTELYNVPASRVDMIIGSLAIGLCSSGGFCAGSLTATSHQRHNALSFVFSASLPALLAVSALEGINILVNSPSILTNLQENVRAARAILDRLDCVTIPSHSASPVIHIQLKNNSTSLHPSTAVVSTKPSNPSSVLPRDAASWTWDAESEERILQEVVEDALAQGVLITKAKRLRGQELVDPRPSIRLALTSALSKKDTEKAVNVVKASLVKVIGRRKYML